MAKKKSKSIYSRKEWLALNNPIVKPKEKELDKIYEGIVSNLKKSLFMEIEPIKTKIIDSITKDIEEIISVQIKRIMKKKIESFSEKDVEPKKKTITKVLIKK